MKVLFLTGMYPTLRNPAGGVFITKRLQEMKKRQIDFKAFAVNCSSSIPRRLLSNILHRQSIMRIASIMPEQNETKETKFDDIAYTLLQVKQGILDLEKDKLISDRLIEATRFHQFDIIHAHRAYPEGYWASCISDRTGLPYVITAHGSDIHATLINYAKTRGKILYALERAQKVIFVSSALLRDAIGQGYSGNNAVVIPNGYDPDIFSSSKGNSTKREETIGFIGNLVEVKRADKLPELFHAISKIRPDVRFVVIGDGPLREKIEKGCTPFRVRFTGVVHQSLLPKLMNEFNVLILPSREEGWGCVIKEAQALGIPVAGSNAGGIPEAIGAGGIVIEDGPDFISEFANAVIKLLAFPPDRETIIGEAEAFSWDNIVAKEIAVYENILDATNKSKSDARKLK